MLRAWHKEVTGPDNGGARAALRRVRHARDACLVPEYGRLVVRLRKAGFDLPASRAMAITAEAVAVAEIDAASDSGGPEAAGADEDQAGDDADGIADEEASSISKDEPAAAREEEPSGRAEDVNASTEQVAESFAGVLRASDNGRRIVSPARARLLLQTDDPDQFLYLLRGALTMVRAKGKPAPVMAVAEVVRRWRNPDRRVIMRRHIALALAEDLKSAE